ncbi:MAG: NUDIX hydrolase [Paracoccus sp. (in: a-proteobacteria)]
MSPAPSSSAGQDPARIRDAASIVLIRRDLDRPAVLMGMRGAGAAFMASKFVFPGGAVDAADRDLPLAGEGDPISLARLAIDIRPESELSPRQIVAAALRELAEEAGLLIGRPGVSSLDGYAGAGLVPDGAALHYVFRAITPPGRTRRFDARCLLADAAAISGDPDDFSRAGDELTHLQWVPVDEMRALALPFITEVVLAECAALLGAAGSGPLRPPASVPFFDNREARSRFVQIGDGL